MEATPLTFREIEAGMISEAGSGLIWCYGELFVAGDDVIMNPEDDGFREYLEVDPETGEPTGRGLYLKVLPIDELDSE